MPEYICVKKCHWQGKLRKEGWTYIGDECPNRHFRPLEENGPVKADLETAKPYIEMAYRRIGG